MIRTGTLCEIVSPVNPFYQAWVGRLCTVMGIAQWINEGPIYSLDIALPDGVIGATEKNLRPIVPPHPINAPITETITA